MGESGQPPRRDSSARVAAAVAGTGPLCAGIDPSRRPARRVGPARRRPTGSRRSACAASRRSPAWCPVVKPQVAFFERCGAAGVAALESVLAAARSAGLLVIADAKRGDIGIDHGGLRLGLARSRQPAGGPTRSPPLPTWGSGRSSR